MDEQYKVCLNTLFTLIPFLLKKRGIQNFRKRIKIYIEVMRNSYIYLTGQVLISDPGHISAQISQKQDGDNIYAITKTMCPPSYHHNGFVTAHALGNMYLL